MEQKVRQLVPAMCVQGIKPMQLSPCPDLCMEVVPLIVHPDLHAILSNTYMTLEAHEIAVMRLLVLLGYSWQQALTHQQTVKTESKTRH